MPLLILTNIIFWIIILLLEKVRNNYKLPDLEIDCINSVEKMLSEYNLSLDSVKLEENKILSYSPMNNSIRIPDLRSHSVLDIVSAFHEVGHYVTINHSKLNKKIFTNSQYIIAINRLIVIPLYLIFSLGVFLDSSFFIFISDLSKEILILYFVVSTFLKLAIYFPHEILASKKAKDYIDDNFENYIIKISIKLYVLSFLSQFILFVMCIIIIILLYTKILS